MEEPAIGIDAGTSNSVIGVYQSGKVEIVPNSIGDTYTPSVVDILDEGEYVGEETMLHKIDANNSKNRITEIKRIIGKNFSSLTDKEKEKYNAIEDPKNKDQILIKVIRKNKEEYLSPENIMAFIMKKLVKSASDFLGSLIKRAVITIPAYFDYNQRGAIVESAKYAGIEVLRIINEPTAAALAYGLGTSDNIKESLSFSIMQKDKKVNRKVIVFDLGGGTFDVSILNIKNNKDFQVVTSSGDTEIGGDDFDYKLVDFCINKFCNASKINEAEIREDKNIIRRLKIQCEKAKKKLSNSQKTTIIVYNFFKNLNLYVEITREEFNLICEDLYQRIKNKLDTVIKDSKFTLEEIDDVVVVGGSSRIPKIRTILMEKFGEKKIRDQINPDEAVATGATWQAHKILRSNKSNTDINIIDITPFSLGFAVKSKNPEEQKKGSIMSILIPKDKEISCRSEARVYKTVEDNQKFFRIRLFAGEEKFCKNNKLLKEFEIKNLPEGKAGTVFLKISLEINKDGILFINAEVESIGAKITEQFSLYEKTGSFSLGSSKKKTKIKGKEKLDEIKELTDIMKEKKQLLKTLQTDDQKFRCYKDLSEISSQLIEKYTELSEQNDSDTLYQKLFENYKGILKYYSEMIIISNDEKIIEDLINKITSIFSKLIDDDIESLVNIFKELKEKKPEKYIIIILYCADILYKEGEKILEEGKKYSRYYARKYFVKGDKIKSHIDENLKNYMDIKLTRLYKELETKYVNKVEQIDSFVKSAKNLIETKNSPFVPGSGFSLVGKALENIKKSENAENLDLFLDIFSEMAESFPKDEKNYSETEAYCLVNIIKIKFSLLKNQSPDDIAIYESLMGRIDYIIERIDIDEEKSWLPQYEELKEQIKEKNKPLTPDEQYLKAKEELNHLYNRKIKQEKKPMEFIDFILTNYPFIGYEKSKDLIKNSVCENIRAYIYPKYHPDNYTKREDFIVYNEIYMLLGEMKDDLVKYK